MEQAFLSDPCRLMPQYTPESRMLGCRVCLSARTSCEPRCRSRPKCCRANAYERSWQYPLPILRHDHYCTWPAVWEGA